MAEVKGEPIRAGDYLRHKLTHRRLIALTDEARDKTFLARDLVDGIHMVEPIKVYVVEVEPWRDQPPVGRS